MSEFEVISDGACDLPEEILKKRGIITVPFYVSLNGKDYYQQDVELSNEVFYNSLVNEDVFPKTSMPTSDAYYKEFEKVIQKNKSILCICATESLTSSFSSASNAKNMILENYPDAIIEIINCGLITVAQGLYVLEAVKCRDKGISLNNTVNALQDIKPFGRIIFLVSSTKYLKKGGRIGKVAAIATEILSIKPVIVFKNEEVLPEGIVRSRKNGLKKIVSIVKDTLSKFGEKLENFNFCIGTTYDNNDSNALAEIFKNEFQKTIEYPDMSIGATVGSHTGPGTIGIGIVKKIPQANDNIT